MIRLHVSPDFALPGWKRTRHDLDWRPGLTVADVLPAGWRADQVIALRRGRRLQAGDAVHDGDVLNVALAPTGIDPLSILINIVISVALSFAAAALIGKPRFHRDQRGRGETVYGFAGIRNSFLNGSSVPVVYGLHRVGGVGLSLFSRVENGQDKIFMLLALSEGPIYAIGQYTTNQSGLVGAALPNDLLINANPASGFRDVKASLRLGTNNQSTIADFSEAATTFLVNAECTLIAARFAQDSVVGQEYAILLEDAGLFSVSDVVNLSFNQSGREEEHTVTSRNPATQRVSWTGQPNLFLHLANVEFIRKWGPITIAPGQNADAWDLNFLFPSGLFQINSSGTQESNYVHVQYRMREAGNAWPAWDANDRFEFEDNFLGAQRRTVRLEFPNLGEWEVQVRRITPRNFSEEQYSREVWIDTVNILIFDSFIYPNTALIGVTALASNQLNSGTPNITALVKGRKIGIWNEDDPPTFTDTWTRNPAWIALDILRNSRYGAGQFTEDDGSYDLDRFLAWADYCDEHVRDGSGVESTLAAASAINVGKIYLTSTTAFTVGDVITINPETPTADTRTITFKGSDGGGSYVLLDVNTFFAHAVDEPVAVTHERHFCDLVFDSPTDVWQSVQQVAATARASLVKIGKKIYPVWDRPQEPVQLFTSANIQAGTFRWQRRSLSKAPNTMEVSFLNAEIDYDQDKVRAVTPEAEANVEQTILESIALYGITRASHAFREAWYRLRILLLRHTTIEFRTGLDALAAEPGDVILVEHPALHSGRGCRVAAGSTSTAVALDHAVTIVAGTSYIVRVHHGVTDTLESWAINMPQGEYAAGALLTIAGTWATTPVLGSLAVFGEVDIETGAYLILRVSTAQDLSRQITAVNYDPDVYADSPGVLASSAPFGDGTASSMAQILAGPDVHPPSVSDLQIGERVRESASGEALVELFLSWDFTRDVGGDTLPLGIGHGTRFLVFGRTAGSSTSDDPADARPDGNWLLFGQTADRKIVLGRPFDVGVEYEFVVLPTSLNGGYSNPDDATPVAYTPLGIAGGGTVFDPAAWSGPSLPEMPSGSFLPGSEISAVALMLRQGSSSIAVPIPLFDVRLGGWALGIVLARGPSPLFMVPGAPPAGSALILVREVKQSGLVSHQPLQLTNERVTPVGHTEQLNVGEAASSFAGTKVNTAVEAVPFGTYGRLELSGSNLAGSYETGSKDSTAPVSGKPRAVWLEYEADQQDLAHDWDAADYTWASRVAKCRSWEGLLYDDSPCTITPFVAYSTDGATWSDWVEYRGAPVHLAYRYWKAKLDLARPSVDKQIKLADVHLIVTEGN